VIVSLDPHGRNDPWYLRARNVVARYYDYDEMHAVGATELQAANAALMHAQSSQAAIVYGLDSPGIRTDRDDTVDNHSWVYRPLHTGRGMGRHPANRRIQASNVATYLSNPLWWNIYEIGTSFCLGDGLTAEAEDPEVQEHLDIFGSTEGSIMENPRLWCLRLMLWGELAAPALIDSTGHTRYCMWEPQKIQLVDFEGGDDTRPEYVTLEDSSPTTEGRFKIGPSPDFTRPQDYSRLELQRHIARSDVRASKEGVWRAIRRREADYSERRDFDMRALNRAPLMDGNVLYERWEWAADSRGVPHCISSLEFARRFHKLVYGEINRVHQLKDHVYTIEVPGMKQDEADKKSKEGWAVRLGKIIWLAAGAKLNVHTPDLKAADTSEFFKMLRLLISMPTGVGPIFHGELEATYATAKIQELPAFAALLHLQNKFEKFIRRAIDFYLDTLVLFGAINGRRSLKYKLKLPELSQDLQAKKIANLESIARGLDTAVRARLLWPEQAFEVYQRALHETDTLRQEETLQILTRANGPDVGPALGVGTKPKSIPLPPKPEMIDGLGGGPAPQQATPHAPLMWMQVNRNEADLVQITRDSPELRSSLTRNGRTKVGAPV
jgi:hypothetical protein